VQSFHLDPHRPNNETRTGTALQRWHTNCDTDPRGIRGGPKSRPWSSRRGAAARGGRPGGI
jgi:hypothetical protein